MGMQYLEDMVYGHKNNPVCSHNWAFLCVKYRDGFRAEDLNVRDLVPYIFDIEFF